jgi:hypothetical protein
MIPVTGNINTEYAYKMSTILMNLQNVFGAYSNTKS